MCIYYSLRAIQQCFLLPLHSSLLFTSAVGGWCEYIVSLLLLLLFNLRLKSKLYDVWMRLCAPKSVPKDDEYSSVYSHTCSHPTVSRQRLIILMSVFDQRHIDGSQATYQMMLFTFFVFFKHLFIGLYTINLVEIQSFLNAPACIQVLFSFTSTSLSCLSTSYCYKSWAVTACLHVYPCMCFFVMRSVSTTLFPVITSPCSFHVLYQTASLLICLWIIQMMLLVVSGCFSVFLKAFLASYMYSHVVAVQNKMFS